jgi:hypothetical protein
MKKINKAAKGASTKAQRGIKVPDKPFRVEFPISEVLSLPEIHDEAKRLDISPEKYVRLIEALYSIISPQEVRSLLVKHSHDEVLVNDWEGLFRLYRRGDDYFAEMSDPLWEINSRFRKGGNQKGYGLTSKLQGAFFALLLRKQIGKPLGAMDQNIIASLTHVIGTGVANIWFCDSKKHSEIMVDDLTNEFDKAIKGIWRLRHPPKAVKSSGAKIAKDRVAIETAQELCGNLRRLPTKSEVRFAMEEHGYLFSDERSRAASNWKNLFKRCGLETLKD